MQKIREVHKKLATLDLAKEAAFQKLNSFTNGGILNQYKNSEGEVIGYKVIPPEEDTNQLIIVYKIQNSKFN